MAGEAQFSDTPLGFLISTGSDLYNSYLGAKVTQTVAMYDAQAADSNMAAQTQQAANTDRFLQWSIGAVLLAVIASMMVKKGAL